MKIYLDVSCLNRPFDDQAQERVRLEAMAVSSILEQSARGRWSHVSSAMAVTEIAANPDPEKQRKARELLPERRDIIEIDQAIARRAQALSAAGFTLADAVHVAAAEALRVDVLLTCDDRLIRVAQRSRGLRVRVANPLVWLREQ
jgi:predicted nucleic acid-binding protein